MSAIDEIDSAIVTQLIEDARTSFREIAKIIGVSSDTVISRYLAMQERGNITKATITINMKTIGYQAMATLMIDVSAPSSSGKGFVQQNSSSILQALMRTPSVLTAARTVGDHDLIATIGIKGIEHALKIRNDIARIPGVKDIQISYWTDLTEFPALWRSQQHVLHCKAASAL